MTGKGGKGTRRMDQPQVMVDIWQRMTYGPLSSGFPGSWDFEIQAPWGIPICSAPGTSEFRRGIQMCSVNYYQEVEREVAKEIQGYRRFGFPVQARCLGLQWETQVHSEQLVPRARDFWFGFVSISTTPLSTHSMLELPQHAAFHKSLFFKPSPTVSAPEG